MQGGHNKHTTVLRHYQGQSVLDGTLAKNWRILLLQSLTAHTPLQIATSTFGLGRRYFSSPQWLLIYSPYHERYYNKNIKIKH